RERPPYPAHEDVVVRATAAEVAALERCVKVKDRTTELRELRLGEERRAAPPLERVAIDPETRTKCIFTIAFDEEGVAGEVGILAPRHGELRGIAVHATRRPLCTIEDGVGWPVVAAINDDRLPATRAFHGIDSTT